MLVVDVDVHVFHMPCVGEKMRRRQSRDAANISIGPRINETCGAGGLQWGLRLFTSYLCLFSSEASTASSKLHVADAVSFTKPRSQLINFFFTMRNGAVPEVAGRPLASRFEALAELLGAALTPERFLSEHFDRQSVLLQRTARARPLDDAPLTLDEMDELLVRASLPGTSTELLIFQDLKHVTEYATPHLAYASGASLIINRVDKLWPRVHELCARLARDFRYAYGNVYLTPPGSQTVPPHSDDHDVFIVQLHGTKHWLVWPAVHPLAQHRPFADEQAGKDGRRLPDDGTSRLTLENLGPPELDVLLRPGDVLYIPRGVVHVAHTGQPGALSTGQSVAISAGQTVAISGDANDGGASAKVSSAVPGASLHLTIAIPTADLSLSSTALNAVRSVSRCDERSV